MDSFNFSLRGISHPLNCPVSRLSPSMSTSSIDQFTHDQGKGDSAYSSFSGGSSAPEYSFLYLPDEIHSLPFTDLRNSKIIDNPSVIYSSNSNGVQHWCHSSEGVSLPQIGIMGRHQFNWEPPPPPPARLDSFIATRNLENSKPSPDNKGLLMEKSHPRPDSVQRHKTAQFNLSTNVSDVQYEDPQHMTQAVINTNIQPGRHYFFVTGVSKSTQTNLSNNHLDNAEDKKLNNLHSVQHWCKNVCGDQQVYIQSQGLTKTTEREENYCQNTNGSSCILSQGCNLCYGFQQNSKIHLKDTHYGSLRHHNSCHHIFYLGPENGALLLDSSKAGMASSLQCPDKTNVCNTADCEIAVKRLPLEDMGTDRMNKETNPMMYHLTGEGMGSLPCTLKNESGAKVIRKEMGPDGCCQRNEASHPRLNYNSCSSCSIELNEFPLDGVQEVGHPHISSSNLLKDSAKKSLMDAQSSALMDIAYKKKDLNPPCPLKLMQDLSHNSIGRVENSECLQHHFKEKENFPQPQIIRIGGRKRLTSEQKKLCYSDPEKLHQIEDKPTNRLYSNIDNHKEDLLSKDDLSKQGLVATRRKIFETKGRALSASCLSQTTLKQLQHNAVQAYLERKMGDKIIEAQQATIQTPTKRHSMAGKVSECNCQPACRNVTSKKKLTRPLSASRLLDNSRRSSGYTDLSPPICSEYCCFKAIDNSAEKSSSAENLLKQTKPQDLCGMNSPSAPDAFQSGNGPSDYLPVNNDILSSKKIGEGKSSVSNGQTSSGSMNLRYWELQEEPEVQHFGEPLDCFRSLEKPEQHSSRFSTQGREKRSISFFSEREQNWRMLARRKQFFKQESAPQLRIKEELAAEDNSHDRAHNRAQAISEVALLSAPGRNLSHSILSLSDTDSPLPPPARCQESIRAKTAHLQSSSESRSSSRMKAAPAVQPLTVEQSVDDPEEIFSSFQEAFLNRVETTDSWLINLEAGKSEDRDCSPPQGNKNLEAILNSPAEPQTVLGCPQSEKETIKSTRWVQEEEEEGVSVDEPEPSPTFRTKASSQWEDLVEEVVAEDPSLAFLLFPATNQNTAMKLMEQLLSEDTLLMEDHYKRKEAEKTNSSLRDTGDSSAVDSLDITASSKSASPTSEDQTKENDQVQRNDLSEKKKLLLACIERRLQELEKQREALREEALVNQGRAETIASLVQEKCQPAEFERYTQFVGDLERVVNLLLCLSARLARVQNALSSVDQHTDAEEKESLDSRHRLLCKQRDDAKDLRDNLDKREQVVASILARHLTAEQLHEYRRFVQTTASLLILQKDLDERQRMSEEQLQSLRSSLLL